MMRISWSTLLGIIVLVATVSYSLAEEITLTTYYPSPRGVYNELLANTYRDFGDPANRFLDATGTSQLASVQFFGSLTLGPAGAERTISRWEQALPPGSILMLALPYLTDNGCPGGSTGGFTNLVENMADDDLGRFPRIAAAPGETLGNANTDQGNPLTGSTPGGINVAAATHVHPFMPRYRNFVFCRRD